MGIFAKIRRVYDRQSERIEAKADRMHQEREHPSRQVDKAFERERQLAVERDSKLLGLMTGG